MNINTQAIVDGMINIINSKGLNLLQTYPDDLLKHDRACLEQAAYPKTKIAWMVGHTHTHIFPLGIHEEMNEGVTWVTNLCNDDCFFMIIIDQNGKAIFKEQTRADFEGLARTKIPFAKSHPGDAYWLTENGCNIGHINVVIEGGFAERKGKATITPVQGISSYQKFVLQTWANYEINQRSGSLFTPREVEWAHAMRDDDQLKVA